MEHLNEFVANNWLWIFAWFILLAMIIKSFMSAANDVSPQQAVQIMSHEQGSLIVDIREDNEYQSGHIKESVHIPLSSLKSRVIELEKYKDKSIILGCRSGSRSARAVGILKKHGFAKVHNLRGGMLAWENDNLPIVKG